MGEHIAVIVCGFFGLVQAVLIAWFNYNQKSKDEKTKMDIEDHKRKIAQKEHKNSECRAKVYGKLWHLLEDLGAERVYIVQPHPLTTNEYLSISMEVKGDGVSPMSPVIQNMPMSEVASFASELATRDFLMFKDIESEVKDTKARAILTTNGSRMAVIKKLSDYDHKWIGNIFVEYTHGGELQPVELRKHLCEASDYIQHILPELKTYGTV